MAFIRLRRRIDATAATAHSRDHGAMTRRRRVSRESPLANCGRRAAVDATVRESTHETACHAGPREGISPEGPTGPAKCGLPDAGHRPSGAEITEKLASDFRSVGDFYFSPLRRPPAEGPDLLLLPAPVRCVFPIYRTKGICGRLRGARQ